MTTWGGSYDVDALIGFKRVSENTQARMSDNLLMHSTAVRTVWVPHVPRDMQAFGLAVSASGNNVNLVDRTRGAVSTLSPGTRAIVMFNVVSNAWEVFTGGGSATPTPTPSQTVASIAARDALSLVPGQFVKVDDTVNPAVVYEYTGFPAPDTFIDHSESGGGQTRHCILELTRRTNDPVFDVTGAGAHYTHAGDTDIDLLASQAAFDGEELLEVLRDGVSVKAVTTWLSPTTFQLLGRYDVRQRVEVRAP